MGSPASSTSLGCLTAKKFVNVAKDIAMKAYLYNGFIGPWRRRRRGLVTTILSHGFIQYSIFWNCWQRRLNRFLSVMRIIRISGRRGDNQCFFVVCSGF
ncbi:MAG: hypothetical protein QXP58_09125 [Thermoprotei archaeon]